MESHDVAIVRLARTARVRGVQVFRETASGAWFATSASQPGTIHRVTALSCDCMGFVAHQRCTHYAALLDRLGWLPQLATDGAETTPCSFCRGRGKVHLESEFHESTCGACDGRGWFYTPTPSNVITLPVVDQPRPAA